MVRDSAHHGASLAAATTDALALTPYSQRGSTGRVYLFFDAGNGVSPQVRCNWRDGSVQPRIDLPGFRIHRAAHHRGVRQKIVAKYQSARRSGGIGSESRDSQLRIRRSSGDTRRLSCSPGSLNVGVAHTNTYSVWISVKWFVHPRHPRRIGSSLSYMESFDFSSFNNGTVFNPINVGGDNSVGWCIYLEIE